VEFDPATLRTQGTEYTTETPRLMQYVIVYKIQSGVRRLFLY